MFLKYHVPIRIIKAEEVLTPPYGNNFKVNSNNDFDYDVCKQHETAALTSWRGTLDAPHVFLLPHGRDHLEVGLKPQALRGFLLMVTRQGKLLYLSENAADYLAHSVEEIMSQGDSFYDLVDQRDHVTVQSELLSGPPTFAVYPDRRVFMCRMNVCRTARRHPQYHKFVFIHGHYLHPIEYCNLVITQNNIVNPVFAAYCCPLITPENAEILAPGNTNVFCSWHSLDLKFLDADELASFHLAYEIEDLLEKSLYALLHPSDLSKLSTKHKLLSEDKESGCMQLLRLKTGLNEFTWVHLTMKLKDIAREDQSVQMIAVTYQILSDIERATLQANQWIYSTAHRLQTVDQPDLSLYNGTKTADVVNCQSYVIDPTSNFSCVSVSVPLFDPADAHLLAAAISDTTATPAKPRRKYATYKAKKAVQKKVNDPDTKREIDRKSNDYKQKSSKIVQSSQTKLNNSKKRFSLTSGLSPPTSADSTEEDHRSLSKIKSISVHIPQCHLPLPCSLPNASLVLTPEVSPYDEKIRQCQKSTNDQHCQQNGHSLPISSGKNYSIATNNIADPILGSVPYGYLPVLEPLSLEAYLQTVEAENCLPVFGAGGASFENLTTFALKIL
uniref:PAS domain-containing protein n=1 Tax=Romanomermis culicivorax TaxID=13658 RepID=A0A915JCD8_ROMCU